jgi:hypothetical protein
MSPADAIFGYGRFVRMSQTNVSVVLLDPGINGTASLHNVNLTTFGGYAVHVWGFQYQVVIHRQKKTGNFPRREAHRLDVPGSIWLMRLSRVDKWNNGDRSGLLRGCGDFFGGLRARRICRSP